MEVGPREPDVGCNISRVVRPETFLRSIDCGQESSEESREESRQGGEESRQEIRPQESGEETGEEDEGIGLRLLLQVASRPVRQHSLPPRDYDEKEPSKAKISTALSVYISRS